MIKSVTGDYVGKIQSATDLRSSNHLVLLHFSLTWLAVHLVYDTLYVAISDLSFPLECVPRVITFEAVNEGLFLVLNRDQQLLRRSFELGVSDGRGPDVLHDLILVFVQSLSIIDGQGVHEGFRLGRKTGHLLTAKL